MNIDQAISGRRSTRGFLNTPQGKNALGLPTEWTPVAPIIVGHPKSAPAPVTHKAPEVRRIG